MWKWKIGLSWFIGINQTVGWTVDLALRSQSDFYCIRVKLPSKISLDLNSIYRLKALDWLIDLRNTKYDPKFWRYAMPGTWSTIQYQVVLSRDIAVWEQSHRKNNLARNISWLIISFFVAQFSWSSTAMLSVNWHENVQWINHIQAID